MTTKGDNSRSVRRIVRRRWIAAAVLLSPFLYASSYVTACFLHGAGILPAPVFNFLIDTAFAPLETIDGYGEGRIGWLFDMGEDAYFMGMGIHL